MKKFTIEIVTSGTYEVEVAEIENDPDEIAEYEISETLDDFGDYIVSFGMHDDFGNDGSFELTVYDPDGNTVYHTDDYDDINRIASPFDIDDYIDDKASSETEKECLEKEWKPFKNEWKKKYDEEENRYKGRAFAVRTHVCDGRTLKFIVEDTEFDPEKLFFMGTGADSLLSEANDNGGLYADNLTDLKHFVYNMKFITENSAGDEDDCHGESGCYDAVADMR